MIKILYFDTSAIIKYFIKETGSELVRWIVDKRVENSFTLHTSQISLYEFPKALNKKVKNGELNHVQMKKIIAKSKFYFPNVFRVRDFKPIPGFRNSKDTTYLELCMKHDLKVKRNGWDARHLACVINYLRCFGGVSRPRVLTADRKRFPRMIRAEGFDVINPEKISIDKFLSIVNS